MNIEANEVVEEIRKTLIKKVNEYDEKDSFLSDSDFSYDLIYRAIEDDLFSEIFDEDESVESLCEFFNLKNDIDNSDEDLVDEFLENLAVKIVEYFNNPLRKEQLIND